MKENNMNKININNIELKQENIEKLNNILNDYADTVTELLERNQRIENAINHLLLFSNNLETNLTLQELTDLYCILKEKSVKDE